MTTQALNKEHLVKIIEAADVVLNALSGTSDDIHPEDSTKMVSAWDWLNDNMAPPAVVKELARFALAAHEQEPSATLFKSGDSAKVIMIGSDLPDGYTDVFAHPAPSIPAAVPEERKWLFYCEKYPEMPMGDAIIRAVEWNACRAAMLQSDCLRDSAKDPE